MTNAEPLPPVAPDTGPTIELNGHFYLEPGLRLAVDDIEDRWLKKQLLEGVRRSRTLISDLAAHLPAAARDLLVELRRTAVDIRCPACGDHLELADHDDGLAVTNPCRLPGARKPFEVTVDVPSGRLVFANDLRHLVVVESSVSVNHDLGRQRYTEAHARAGLVLIHVGNTCPGVHREADGSLFVGWVRDEDWDDEDDAPADPVTSEKLGSICTDLWWYSAMDEFHFLRACAREGVDPKSLDTFTVEVPPGVYAFSDERADPDGDRPVLSRIRRVDRPAPAIDDGRIAPAQGFADSELARHLRDGVAGWGPVQTMSFLFVTLGNGMTWVDGHLRNVTRHAKDAPFVPHQDLEGHLPHHGFALDRIPCLPWSDDMRIYPMSWGIQPPIGCVPLAVDPWWLAGMILFARTAVAHPGSFGFPRHPNPDGPAVMQTVLDVLLDIVKFRGLEMTPYYAAIVEAVR